MDKKSPGSLLLAFSWQLMLSGVGFDKSILRYAAVKGREHKVTIDKMNLENDECLCESAFTPGTGSAINSMC